MILLQKRVIYFAIIGIFLILGIRVPKFNSTSMEWRWSCEKLREMEWSWR
jgi:hypothetical protein